MTTRKFSGVLVLLFAMMFCLGAAQSEAATYGKIERLSSNYPLNGDSRGYNVKLTLSQSSIELTAHAISDTSTLNNGTKIEWEVIRTGGTSNATYTFDPSSSVNLDGSGKAKVTIRFADPRIDDKFTVKAYLKNDGGTTLGSNATVEVAFIQSIELTDVKISPSSITIRENVEGVYLSAVPSPNTATNVTYTWSSDNSDIVAPVQQATSPDMARLTVAKAGSTRVHVTANGENSTSFGASCDIIVVAKDVIADDMIVSPTTTGDWKPSDEEAASTVLYGTDVSYISAYYNLDSATILSSSGIYGGNVLYLIGSGKQNANVYINRTMITSTMGLNISDYDTRVVSAMRIISELPTGTAAGSMIPMRISYNLTNLLYPDGRTRVENASSASDFHNKFRIMKYFETGTTKHSINISDVLSKKRNPYVVRDTTTGSFILGPLVVLVDSLAPLDWCDAYAGDNKEYGVKYDNTNNILFIYDGNPNAKIEDPIVLEKRPSGGGGGGGCSAGAGVFALLGLGFAVLRSKKD